MKQAAASAVRGEATTTARAIAVLGAAAAELAERACPSRIAGMVIARTDRPGFAAFGSSGTARPLDEDTIFEIGSLTKTMTGLLLADAVVRGELALDDQLGRWLPEASATGGPRPVTLLDVATHTARLPGNLPGFVLRVMLTHRSNPFRGATPQRLHRAAARTTPDDGLGETYAYSNIGFALLGQVLERATGTPYADLLRARITGPLGMPDTGMAVASEAQDRVAIGHLTQRGPTEPLDAGVFAAAGGARSTVRDLRAYAQAHLDPDRSPLGPAIRLATTAHREPRHPAPGGAAMGLGWHHDRTASTTTWHNGGAMGMGSWLGFRVAAGRAVVILINSGWRRVPLLHPIARAVLDQADSPG